jgi:hypothetical protein
MHQGTPSYLRRVVGEVELPDPERKVSDTDYIQANPAKGVVRTVVPPKILTWFSCSPSRDNGTISSPNSLVRPSS